MTNFRTYKFADLYRMSSGISSKPEQAGHGAPFLSFSAVYNNYFIREELEEQMDTSEAEQKKYSIKEGDVFLTRTSEVVDELAMSSVALKDYPEATYSGFLKRVRPTQSGITYPKFMAFYLRGPLFRKTMTNNAVMTLRASLNEDIFSYLDLVVPNFSTQMNIGDLLYLLNLKIELNNRINNELEKMSRMIFDYWFVQFDFPDVNGEPYKASGGKMVYNSILKREIPNGWTADNVLRVAELLGGGTPSKSNKEYWIGKIPFFTPADVGDTLYQIRTDAYINEKAVKNSSTTVYDRHTVFITARGSVGKLVLNSVPMAMNQSCYALRALEKSNYVYLTFMAKELIHHLEVKASGSVFNSIVSNDIKQTYLAFPSNSQLLQQFAEVVNPIFTKIEKTTLEIDLLINLRDWLLPLLMNGQVTVKDF